MDPRPETRLTVQHEDGPRPGRVAPVSTVAARRTGAVGRAGGAAAAAAVEVRQGPAPVGASSGGAVGGPWWRAVYGADWMPKEVFIKVRQKVQTLQLGANLELRRGAAARRNRRGGPINQAPTQHFPIIPKVLGFQAESCNVKLVLKPSREGRLWKVLCDPQHGDVRFLTRKIDLGPLFRLQVGVGHSFRDHSSGFKWKLTSAWGWGASSQPPPPSSHSYPPPPTLLRRKSTFPIAHGVDARIGWSAEYSLPDLHGAFGTGEPLLGLNVGRLYASVDRVEAVFTYH